jgi:hypothetical protein
VPRPSFAVSAKEGGAFELEISKIPALRGSCSGIASGFRNAARMGHPIFSK